MEKLSAPYAPLHVDAVAATWRMHTVDDTDPYSARYLPDRIRLHRVLIEQFLGLNTGVVVDGLAAVVTAGPPAVGKSTRLGQLGYETTWRRIDPDVFKVMLIKHDSDNGALDIPREAATLALADGRGITPLELSGLYHRESTVVADKAQQMRMAAHENVIIEGTLSWDQLAFQLIVDLVTHDYERLDVVLVEASLETALEQALQRWWQERQRGGLGGRFTPAAAIRSLYETQTTTVCAMNAKTLVQKAQEANLDATLRT